MSRFHFHVVIIEIQIDFGKIYSINYLETEQHGKSVYVFDIISHLERMV